MCHGISNFVAATKLLTEQRYTINFLRIYDLCDFEGFVIRYFAAAMTLQLQCSKQRLVLYLRATFTLRFHLIFCV